MSREILQVSGLSMRFGGLLAVNGVGLTVKEKQVVALIGPNGAGKTTVFNCLTGFYKPSGGTILLDGQPIQGLAGHQIARKGVVRTFQNVRLFKEMTALENLLIAQHRHLNTNFFAGLFKTPASAAAKGGHGARAVLAGKGQPDRVRQPYRRHPRLRPAAPPGNRPLHDDPAAHHHARRTGRRPEPEGNRRPQGADRLPA
jgi:ABC-type branched-subunit amino acid transport system ATPase component